MISPPFPPLTVSVLPDPSDDEAEREPSDATEQSGRRGYSKEVPQTARELAYLQLSGEVAPRKGSGAKKAREEPAIRGEILNRYSAELIKLGQAASSAGE